MFVHPTRLKALGAAIVGTLTLGACDDPVASTDLRPEGPPDVLAVLVFNDTVNGAIEAATYCKPNDEKRPGQVGIPAYGVNPTICPLDGSAVPPLTDAWPDAWYVRIMFDELLDPDVETLIPILDAMGNPTDNYTGSLALTQPVTLKCTSAATGALVDVPYDGYYSPSGNSVTWPLGPSLVIQPIDPTIVPVESECEITLKESITDKDGNPVPAGDRMPFKFKIAPVSVIGFSPGDGDSIDPSAGGIELAFNVEIDGTDLCADPDMATCFSLSAKDGDTAVPVDNQFIEGGGPAIFVGADTLGGLEYTLKIPENFKIKDKCGVESTVVGSVPSVTFETNAVRFVSVNPGGGNSVAPSKKITLSFNQLMDTASFVKDTDFTISPEPANFALVAVGGGTGFRLNGDYNLDTEYVLTIKAGASIDDVYGKQALPFAAEQVVRFKTAKDIAITAQSPADGATITKAAMAAAPIRLTFNQEIAAASLEASEFTLTKADGSSAGVTPAVSAAGAVVTISAPALPAGSYIFTLKQGATLQDKIAPTPNTYTQASDKVIRFTVKDAAPPPENEFKCLGAP